MFHPGLEGIAADQNFSAGNTAEVKRITAAREKSTILGNLGKKTQTRVIWRRAVLARMSRLMSRVATEAIRRMVMIMALTSKRRCVVPFCEAHKDILRVYLDLGLMTGRASERQKGDAIESRLTR